MYLTQDYKDIVELFNLNRVRYMVVGAYAMATFGYARSTYDIDLWVSKDEENVVKVLKSLEEFGVPFEISKEDFLKEDSIIQIGVVPNRIDILTSIDGVDFESAWNSKEVKTFDDIKINVLDIDNLIKNKSATNRSKDEIDVKELKKLKEDLK